MVKMRIIVVTSVRFCLTLEHLILKVNIIQVCDTTVQKYSNLPLRYQKPDFFLLLC